MTNHKAPITFIIAFLLIVFIGTNIFPQEKIIRYKRYKEPLEMTSYFAVGTEYAIDSELLTVQAGLILDIRMSAAFFISAEGFVVTEDFERYSFNVGAILDYRIMEGETAPFIGAGVSLHIPTSATLSTELVAKANIGIYLADSLRFSVYYTTPVDHIFEYSSIGVNLGI